MKQVKFLLVALMAVVMGVSVTSCMKGEDNSIVPVGGIITLKNTFPYQFQVEGSGVVYEASNLTIPGLSADVSTGDIILLQAQYDTKKQAVDQNTKKIVVDVSAALKLNEKTMSSLDDVEFNRSIIPLSRYGSDVVPFLYSANWVIFPMPFYVEKDESISNHQFYLVYDKKHADNNTNTMVLRLRHVSSDDATKETIIKSPYKAFDLRNVVSAFEGELKTIKIITQEQKGNSTKIDANSEEGYENKTYVIENYDKFVK